MPKHFITIRDLGYSGAWELLIHAADIKNKTSQDTCMKNKIAALIFEKAPVCIQVSFEVAIQQLGGTTISIKPNEYQTNQTKSLKDTVCILSQYVDCIIMQTSEQKKLDELVTYSKIPIVNALTEQTHPCQIMSDLLTIYERNPDLNIRIAWIGNGNNVLNSWIEASMYFPFELFIAIPESYEPNREILGLALQVGAKIFLTHEPELAIANANYIYGDIWTARQKTKQTKNLKTFENFYINSSLMAKTAPKAKILYCFPTHQGEEIPEEIIENSDSLILEQIQNKLHIQKALLRRVLSDKN